MDCVSIGDSIAVGVAQVSRCRRYAQVGISSGTIARNIPQVAGDVAIISAGSNDPQNPNLASNLREIRSKVRAKKVIWLVPYDRHAARIVRSVAISLNDPYIELSNYPSRDRVHPSSYSRLAQDAL